MKNARHLKHALSAAFFLTVFFFLAACNPIENQSQSASLLTVERLTGTDMAGTESDLLQSDVLYEDPETGAKSWRADMAKAVLSASTLDPDPLLGTSQYNDILITRYIVTYFRSDGKNRQGVDIPYSFEGGLSVLIRIGTSTTLTIMVVRESAKQEQPLLNLYTADPNDALYVTARVDFYGHDLANKTVMATGYLNISFANYINK